MAKSYPQYTTHDLNQLLEHFDCSTAKAAQLLHMKRSSMAQIRKSWENPHTGEKHPNYVPYSIIFTLTVQLDHDEDHEWFVPKPDKWCIKTPQSVQKDNTDLMDVAAHPPNSTP